MNIQFQRAERKQSKLRLAITGPTGSGKTYGALSIATGLGGRIAVLDTENGSASLYADEFEFDVINLAPPYSPERFIEVIKAAESAGYDNLIIDSTTHEWSGVGGCLELVDKIAPKFKGNTWSAWSEVTPRHRAFIDAMLQSRINIIATMRSKMDSVQQDNGNGKKQVVKLGLKAEQRDGIEYEFTVVLDLIHDGHYAVATKDRTRLFSGTDPQRLGVDTGKRLLAWLNSGKADQVITAEQVDILSQLFAQARGNVATYCQKRGLNSLADIKANVFDETVAALQANIAKNQQGASEQSAPQSLLDGLLNQLASAQTEAAANDLLKHANGLNPDEVARLRTAIGKRLLELNNKAASAEKLSLATRMQQCPDSNDLDVLSTEIQFEEPKDHPALWDIYNTRSSELNA